MTHQRILCGDMANATITDYANVTVTYSPSTGSYIITRKMWDCTVATKEEVMTALHLGDTNVEEAREAEGTWPNKD